MGEGRREINNVGDGLRRNKGEDFLNATRDNKKKNSLYLSGFGERANKNLRATQAEALNHRFSYLSGLLLSMLGCAHIPNLSLVGGMQSA